MAWSPTVEQLPPSATAELPPSPSPLLDSRRIAAGAVLLLPAGLVVYFAFSDGGFFPGPSAYVAVALCVVLVLRVTLAADPVAGVGRWGSLVVGGFALYTLLTLVSQIWSHAPGVALVEFDRSLAYLLVMVLCGSIAHRRERFAWVLRAIAVAIVAICVCSVTTRLLPNFWPTAPGLVNNRLSFPLTYWNALGIIGALGIVLCVHFTSDPREAVATRVIAAAALPVVVTTTYFTFSRGGIAAALIGVVVYLLIARPRAVLGAALATVPATAIAVKVAYDANLLATVDPTTPGAVAQGKHVAVTLLLCVLAAALLRALLAVVLDQRLARLALPERLRAPARWVRWGGAAFVAIVAVIALHGQISNEYHGFVRSPGPTGSDLRARLTDPSNNGRIDMWRVAWHQFERAPVLGHGAGTFANTWAQYRPSQDFVLDAHSLYFETIDELGIVGIILLVGVIVAVLVRTATRARGPNRPLYAAAFALILIWALHAGFDWDWEMPAVTLPFFALGGFVLSRSAAADGERAEPRDAASIAPLARLAMGVVCLLVAVAPAFVWLSQQRLNNAAAAFERGDCQTATSSALSSISVLGDRAEPYEIVGYCDIRRGMPGAAIAAVKKAISLDPNNWNYAYDLAVMRAAAGQDPVPAAYRALTLNPKEPLIRQAIRIFTGASRSQLERRGTAIANGFDTL